ncbi:hypothetical protein CBS63078_5644 [Aspergillus niger]|nr:hypothetical protein CBS13152_3564 [Aspergillus niger]KAI2904430.1 hypothetical protein CBS63078_5644 [Aspergillus niger]KAI3039133.1 hypothetical protein CBS76997_8102 [Aspergillus niger]
MQGPQGLSPFSTHEICAAVAAECFYPEPTRRRRSQPATQQRRIEDTLSVILERLQRLEERTTPTSTNISRHSSEAPESLSENTSCKTPPEISNDYASSCDTPAVSSGFDGAAVLQDALDRVQRLRHQTTSVETIEASLDIPRDLAKAWVRSYFELMPTDMFLTFINRNVLELMPDIVGLPYVHVDAAIIVVYYCVLYHGCSLPVKKPDDATTYFPGIRYSRRLYLCSLRSLPGWQREATGSMIDFIAALFMTRAASESFDFDLSWKMFTLACDYSKGLNLHNLDNESDFSALVKTNLDEARKGFWELIHMEFFYRLTYNRPPAISANMSAWRVNLPWLGVEQLFGTAEVPTIKFLLSSRVTFVLIDFFQLLEEAKAKQDVDLLTKVEIQCREIDGYYSEWNIDGWMAKSKDKEIDSWMLADITVMVYSCILFMIRKTVISVPNSPNPNHVNHKHGIPRSDIALRAARYIITAAHHLLLQCPHPETVALLFGTYRIEVAYTYLVSQLDVEDVQNPRAIMADLKLLELVTKSIAASSRQEPELVPLLSGLHQLNARVGARMNVSYEEGSFRTL